MTVSLVARRHGVAPNQLFTWRRSAAQGSLTHRCITRIAAVKADSSGRRNTLMKEVAMKIRKGRSDRSGRAPLSSPGRPSVAGRDERRRFWAAIAVDLESEDAALEAGVPPALHRAPDRLVGERP
jgi:hypothetical protein